eukprot:2199360-Pyramimonas_sp.AAC.1
MGWWGFAKRKQFALCGESRGSVGEEQHGPAACAGAHHLEDDAADGAAADVPAQARRRRRRPRRCRAGL